MGDTYIAGKFSKEPPIGFKIYNKIFCEGYFLGYYYGEQY